MIKVLHVVPTLGYGGVAKVVCNYNDVIDKNQYQFDFVTHGKEEDYHSRLIDSGSKIYYFKTIGQIGIRRYKKQISESLHVQEYDVVHIHTGDLTGIYAKCYRDLGAKKIVCHAHTTKAVTRTHKYFEWILRRIALKYSDERLACGYDAGCFCFGKDNFIILPNGIDYDNFNNVSKEQIKKIKASLGIDEKTKVVGHVGHFSPPKNHYFLIDFFENYLEKDDNVVLVLCGNGPRFEDIMRRVSADGQSEHIILTGIRNDINVLMQMFDVFVLPSLHEGLPVVGIEAQTAGKKCLFSDQIDHGVDIGCGLSDFIPIDQGPEPWVNALYEVLHRVNDIDSLDVKKALKKSGYDIYESVKTLTEVYQGLVEKQ